MKRFMFISLMSCMFAGQVLCVSNEALVPNETLQGAVAGALSVAAVGALLYYGTESGDAVYGATAAAGLTFAGLGALGSYATKQASLAKSMAGRGSYASDISRVHLFEGFACGSCIAAFLAAKHFVR